MNLDTVVKVEPNESPCSSPQDSSSVGPSCSPSDENSTSTTTVTEQTTNNSSSRKRSNSVVKDPQTIAEELIRKRARNTDAARRSRQRKIVKMENLEKQVAELTIENNDLKTRLTVLEVEKKSLEEKNSDKRNRIKMLERQLSEAHQRIVTNSRKKKKF